MFLFSDILERIHDLGEKMVQHYNLPNPTSLDTTTQNDATFIGRIACEHSGEGKMNEHSVLLEDDANHLVKVNLSSSREPYSLFPGQVTRNKFSSNMSFFSFPSKTSDLLFLFFFFFFTLYNKHHPLGI